MNSKQLKMAMRISLGFVISLAGCEAHRSATRIAASPSHAPAYPVGRGPVILWDSGHYNFGKVKNIEEIGRAHV